MNRLIRTMPVAGIILSAILLLPLTAQGVQVVECEDKKGERSFYQKCPLGTTQVNAVKIRGKKRGAGDVNANIEATIYMIPDCESCIEVIEFLRVRGIRTTRKMVHEDIDTQNELRDLTGNLSAPTTVIGEQILTGYSRTKLLSALEAAGYVDPATAEADKKQ